jgi:hypothetical protein
MVRQTTMLDLLRSSNISPIFTYSGRGTTKPGVAASEHGIAYSWGSQATPLPGETGITKTPLMVVMTPGEDNLHVASRIYYGIHHPIQYNVKVRDIGYVIPDQVHILIQNWKEEDGETKQSGNVTAYAEVPQDDMEDTLEDFEDDRDHHDPTATTSMFESVQKPEYWCQIAACRRSNVNGDHPFPRLDKMRDHMRKVHARSPKPGTFILACYLALG